MQQSRLNITIRKPIDHIDKTICKFRASETYRAANSFRSTVDVYNVFTISHTQLGIRRRTYEPIDLTLPAVSRCQQTSWSPSRVSKALPATVSAGAVLRCRKTYICTLGSWVYCRRAGLSQVHPLYFGECLCAICRYSSMSGLLYCLFACCYFLGHDESWKLL